MTAIRQPRSIAAAETLCARYADNVGAVERIEDQRNRAIADANSAADAKLAPILEEQGKIEAKLAPWWESAKDELTEGKRKSIELGGCIVGTRAGRTSLDVKGKPADVVEQLQGKRWATKLLRVNVSIDKKATIAALDGPRADELKALGLSVKVADEQFLVQRAEQGGTIAKR